MLLHLKVFFTVVYVIFFSSRCMLELEFAVYHRGIKDLLSQDLSQDD